MTRAAAGYVKYGNLASSEWNQYPAEVEQDFKFITSQRGNLSPFFLIIPHKDLNKTSVNLSPCLCLPQTHSLTHRRAVLGRRKHFDILLAEHKGRPKEGAKEKDKEGTQGGKEGVSHCVASQETSSPNKPHCHNGRPLSTLKLRLANAHIPR